MIPTPALSLVSRVFLLMVGFSNVTAEYTSKKYFCEKCFYTTNDRSNMKRHQRTHSQERPYSCDICGKSFTRKGYLDFHVMDKHIQELIHLKN
ncbi:unnamed protein product [Larinioides sclopetarius]|uniref:C2H2-type domain-containing protein n=1 Tax=Larinioides sclopetarius TaxID=280406 RepID=A0AAV1ZUX1_9ARAC